MAELLGRLSSLETSITKLDAHRHKMIVGNNKLNKKVKLLEDHSKEVDKGITAIGKEISQLAQYGLHVQIYVLFLNLQPFEGSYLSTTL